MASHLTFQPAFGAAPSNKSAAAKSAPQKDDTFSNLVDTRPAPAKSREKSEPVAANTNTPADTSASANRDTPQAPAEASNSEAAIDPAAIAEPVAQDEQSTETDLADALLSALAALVGNAEGEEMPAELKDVEEALDQLAAALGIDLSSLVQQLTKLVETVGSAGSEGGEGELVAKLTDWLAQKLGTPIDTLEPEIQANLTRFVDATKKLAQPLPTEPELAEPALKLVEPVLTGKTAATDAATPASAPATDEADPDAASRAAPEMALRDTKSTDTGQNRAPQPQAASPAAPAEVASPAISLQPAQADSVQLPTDSSAAAPRVVQTGYQTSQQQLNLPQIAFEMARQVDGGNTRFQIRLDPPELGRIDVKLDIDSNGQVNARLTVEKAETLDLMQRDQRALERALQQAGLDANKTNLEFSLKQNPFAGDQNERTDRDSGTADIGEGSGDETEAAPAVTLYRGSLQASGLNIIA